MARITHLAVLLPFASFFAGLMLRFLSFRLEDHRNNVKEDNYISGKLQYERQDISAEQPTDYSFTGVSVLCWVMTSPDNLFSKAIHIHQTWGTRCNLTVYVTEEKPYRPFPGRLVILPVDKGRKGLWGKTRAAFTFIFEHYQEDFDWFLKADDDTYVIVDNLRYFLHSRNVSEPSYFGWRFRIPNQNIQVDYMSGGAGYVINKEALFKFMSVMYTPRDCPFEGQTQNYPEDFMVGYCLMKAGVTVHSSLDSLGRSRFLPLYLKDHILGSSLPDWMFNYSQDLLSSGMDCCSDYLVSIHYVSPEWMYLMEFLTQHLRLASKSREHCYYVNGQKVPI